MSAVALKIDRGVPMPSGRLAGLSPLTHALRTMEIGDSFLCEKIQTRLHAYFRNAPGRKFATRTENGKTRVWRTA